MIITILDCGIRIGELVQLKVHDVDFQQRIIMVRSAVSKTVTECHLPLSKKTAEYLLELVKYSQQTDCEFIFQSTYGGAIKREKTYS